MHFTKESTVNASKAMKGYEQWFLFVFQSFHFHWLHEHQYKHHDVPSQSTLAYSDRDEKGQVTSNNNGIRYQMFIIWLWIRA